MIAKKKTQIRPERLSTDELEKKRVRFNTLQTIIASTVRDQELANTLISEIESHIRYRNEKRTYNRMQTSCPELIKAFKNHYAKRYAITTLKNHSVHIGKFIGYLQKNYSYLHLKNSKDCKNITKSMVISYEEYQVDRMNQGLIQKSTLNQMLCSVKIFLDMLSKEKIIHIRYFVRPALRANGKRSNEYVNLDEVLALLESIGKSKSNIKLKDMSIIMLIMELGCRPIEVANLKLEDIRFTDRLITLKSVKSKTRTLKISKDLAEIIREYVIKWRSAYECDHGMLFVNQGGNSTSSLYISCMFRKRNLQCFKEIRLTAKALRHTYATNALDNENDFDQVSESLGHKHRRSTEWYIHRSVTRMLARTLPHNPLTQFEEV
ncbi:MAG: site-specific integrase [Paenibacillus sp.]|nr:site-specific integrase [Paenibacillus sp.]